MATRADPLKCQACLELYKDPFLLPCLHSFCKKCLVAEKEQHGDSEGKLKCPTCNSGFAVPSGGISGFTQNFSLARQVEMSTYEKKFSSDGKIPCDHCPEQANGYAVVLCCQCCFFLCLSCKEKHQSWQHMADHELVEIGKGKKQVIGYQKFTKSQYSAHNTVMRSSSFIAKSVKFSLAVTAWCTVIKTTQSGHTKRSLIK